MQMRTSTEQQLFFVEAENEGLKNEVTRLSQLLAAAKKEIEILNKELDYKISLDVAQLVKDAHKWHGHKE